MRRRAATSGCGTRAAAPAQLQQQRRSQLYLKTSCVAADLSAVKESTTAITTSFRRAHRLRDSSRSGISSSSALTLSAAASMALTSDQERMCVRAGARSTDCYARSFWIS